MTDSYGESSTVARDLIRLIFSMLDRPVYGLLLLVYELFFNVASADLFSNNTIMKFYGRVQVILGVFMMFQLAMTFLRGIVEPDSFSKDKGGGSLLRRVATSLILITVLMPISIGSPRNEYEKQINNNGLLFGTLYSLQHRILANNTLGRLVLGTTDSDTTFMGEDEDEELKKSARIFTSTVLKGFYRINLIPEEDRVDSGTKDPATINENRMCKDIDDDILAAYTRLDADPGEIIGMVNETCNVDFNLLNYIPVVNAFAGSKKYIFSYTILVPTIVGIIFIFVLLSFTVDVAVRAVKLAVLRLLAPIPILAYMDPKGSRDEAFKSWTKTLTTTYLDLFIRLATVYFVIFLIQDMIVNGVVINHGSGVIGVFSLIIIWIGLFIFAKQAPKFIKQVLGLKEDPGKLFGGFGEIMAAGAVGASVVGGAVSKGVGTYASTGNIGKAILGGITGGIAGGHEVGKAYMSQKEADAAALMNKVRANNARNYSQTSDDSTAYGRFVAGFQSNFGLQNEAQRDDVKIARYQRAEAAWKGIQNALNSDDWKGRNVAEHQSRGGYVRTGDFVSSSTGETLLTNGSMYSTKQLRDTLDRMKSSGRYSQSEINDMDSIVKGAEKGRFDYIRQHSDSLGTPVEHQIYEGARQIYETASKYTEDPDGVWSEWSGKQLDDPGLIMGRDFKGAGFAAGREATAIKSSARYSRAQANAKRAEEKKK